MLNKKSIILAGLVLLGTSCQRPVNATWEMPDELKGFLPVVITMLTFAWLDGTEPVAKTEEKIKEEKEINDAFGKMEQEYNKKCNSFPPSETEPRYFEINMTSSQDTCS